MLRFEGEYSDFLFPSCDQEQREGFREDLDLCYNREAIKGYIIRSKHECSSLEVN